MKAIDFTVTYCYQGRIFHIGKLGTCLGQQFNRGGTLKEEKEIEDKLYSSAAFTSNSVVIQAYLVSKRWEFHLLLPFKVSSFVALKIDAAFAEIQKKS